MPRRALNGSPPITNRHGTPGFGHFGRHAGYDYGVNGATVVAPEAGTIISISHNTPDGGNIVELKGKYTHRFLHLKSISVTVGQKVAEGQKLGVSGATGKVSGPHLHHDTRKKGTAWNASYSNYVDWEKLIEGEDMYKGKSAKYWYEQYVHKTQVSKVWRKRFDTLVAKVKSLIPFTK